MRIMVATSKGQGRPGDYCATIEGEPLLFPMICDRDELAREQGDRQGGCGCSRAFGGMSTMRCTTTAVVVETELTEDDLRIALHAALANAGLAPEPEACEKEDLDHVEEQLVELLELAGQFDVGTVLERDFEELREREPL